MVFSGSSYPSAKAIFSRTANGVVLWFTPSSDMRFVVISAFSGDHVMTSHRVTSTIIKPITTITAALLPLQPTVKR